VSRIKLFLLQALVAIAVLVTWYVFSTYEFFGIVLLPPFFFSTPADVAERIVKLFTPGAAGLPGPAAAWWAWVAWPFRAPIWWHLGITLTETLLAFMIGAAGSMSAARVDPGSVCRRRDDPGRGQDRRKTRDRLRNQSSPAFRQSDLLPSPS
jgi:ABC-type nitrate/sulfonate/bicarbonate transport system permease component